MLEGKKRNLIYMPATLLSRAEQRIEAYTYNYPQVHLGPVRITPVSDWNMNHLHRLLGHAGKSFPSTCYLDQPIERGRD